MEMNSELYNCLAKGALMADLVYDELLNYSKDTSLTKEVSKIKSTMALDFQPFISYHKSAFDKLKMLKLTKDFFIKSRIDSSASGLVCLALSELVELRKCVLKTKHKLTEVLNKETLKLASCYIDHFDIAISKLENFL